jgi:thiol:disulfide interchange protein
VKTETKLQKNLFIIEYDPEQVEVAELVETIEALNFEARVLDKVTATAPVTNDADAPAKSDLVAELMAQAKRENRGLVLEFSGKFCPSCVRLEKETLATDEVQSALKRVIFRRIMVEEHRDAARQFGIYGIPQLRFIAPNGTEVVKDEGVISVETMLAHLKTLEDAG